MDQHWNPKNKIAESWQVELWNFRRSVASIIVELVVELWKYRVIWYQVHQQSCSKLGDSDRVGIWQPPSVGHVSANTVTFLSGAGSPPDRSRPQICQTTTSRAGQDSVHICASCVLREWLGLVAFSSEYFHFRMRQITMEHVMQWRMVSVRQL